MRVAVKNNSPAQQGVATLTGTKWIKPGATVTIDVEDTRPLERLPFLEIQFSEAGVPIGDLAPPPASLVAKVKASPAPKPQLDHDGDGKPGGSKRGAASTRSKGASKKRTAKRAKAKAKK